MTDRIGEAIERLLDELDAYETWADRVGEKGGPPGSVAQAIPAARADLRALMDARSALADLASRLSAIGLAHDDGIGRDGHYSRADECSKHFFGINAPEPCNCGADDFNAQLDAILAAARRALGEGT